MTDKPLQLIAKPTPYSSIVGGGVTLESADGQTAFLVLFAGTNRGITRAQTEALASQFTEWVNKYGLTCPQHEPRQ